MIKIIIPCDGFHHYDQPIQEFLKRLGKQVVLKKIKGSKTKTPKEIIKDETQRVQNYLKNEKGYKVLCSLDGEPLDTHGFCNLIQEAQNKYSNIVFIIGGAYGLDESLITDKIDTTISFSSMTFPHAQALMMLLEQIYRTECIKKGSRYHHEGAL